MNRLIFCNIGWMNFYRGLQGTTDKVSGTFSYFKEHKNNVQAHEACNFLTADDGNVYGHVESFRGNNDLDIHLENIGGQDFDEFLDGVSVFWTATHPQEGGRRIVGFYRDARVYRKRQCFKNHPKARPTGQHKQDKVDNFRISCRGENAVLLSPDDRKLRLERGPGWMGQTNWWSPDPDSDPEIATFLDQALLLFDAAHTPDAALEIEFEETPSAYEGRLRLRSHLARERSPNLARKKKKQALAQNGKLACEVCGFAFQDRYGRLGHDLIEVHHLSPLGELSDEKETILNDLALVCSNCHRVIHKGGGCLSLEEVRKHLI